VCKCKHLDGLILRRKPVRPIIGVQEVVGSNPAGPILINPRETGGFFVFQRISRKIARAHVSLTHTLAISQHQQDDGTLTLKGGQMPTPHRELTWKGLDQIYHSMEQNRWTAGHDDTRSSRQTGLVDRKNDDDPCRQKNQPGAREEIQGWNQAAAETEDPS
jgi:hypothetical protein